MTSSLTVTLLDVGWGDSVFLHSVDANDQHHFGLIDSNDSKYIRPSRNYLRRYFRRHAFHHGGHSEPHVFDFVMLSHDHADHRAGLENIMREFGTADFWYPHTERTAGLGGLLDFAEREVNKATGCVRHHEALDDSKPLERFGNVDMKVLWPPDDHKFEESSPNNTSIVLCMTLGKWSVVLTGDAEEEAWDAIANKIPKNTRFFKVPHHGSVNGTFAHGLETPWFDRCPRAARLGISGDLYGALEFPRPEVLDLFVANKRKHFRTDLHHHIAFHTDGTKYDVTYSH